MNTDELRREYLEKGVSEADVSLLAQQATDSQELRRWLHRRLFSEPLGHILGDAQFCSLKLKVESGIYVPTPETAKLVAYTVLETQKNDYASIIDVGAGCGAIALALKSQLPNADVSGTDINPRAVKLATRNARDLELDVKFYESYYVEDIPLNEPELVVADLPYGTPDFLLPSNCPEGIRFAPLAFFHPLGVMESYVELIESVKSRKWSPRMIIETGPVEKDIVERELGTLVSDVQYSLIDDRYSVTMLEGFG